MRRIRSFKQEERGASLVEYALLVGLIALVCTGAMMFIGKASSHPFSSVGSSITTAS